MHRRHWLMFIRLISFKLAAKFSTHSIHTVASIKAQMKLHFCVKTNRNVNANSVNNVVFDLCLAVLPCPLLINVSSDSLQKLCWWHVIKAGFCQRQHLGCFRVLVLFWERTVSFSELLQGWWKQKNKIILCDVKWDVLLSHTWLFRLLLSSITEKTIWGITAPAGPPSVNFLLF